MRFLRDQKEPSANGALSVGVVGNEFSAETSAITITVFLLMPCPFTAT